MISSLSSASRHPCQNFAGCLPSRSEHLAIHRHKHLGKVKQLRDVVVALVADQLARRLFELSMGRLFSITRKGMPFTKQQCRSVWFASCRRAQTRPRPQPERIVARVLPVNVAEGKALAVAVDSLGNGGAQNKRVVDILIGGYKALDAVRRRLEPAHGFVRVRDRSCTRGPDRCSD